MAAGPIPWGICPSSLGDRWSGLSPRTKGFIGELLCVALSLSTTFSSKDSPGLAVGTHLMGTEHQLS